MSDNYYKIYVDATIALAQTLTIKSEVSADMINDHIKLLYGQSGVNDFDKATWKYYKNICGEYHFSDDMIYITSLDTLEKIPFTKQSFLTHRTTYKAYAFGGRYYRELVDNNPDKEQLILGVLYPADMTTAINAQDGAILSYNNAYIESNEYSLIENIQKWIYNYKIRWNVSSFRVSDNLYPAAEHAQMYLQLVPLILNLRLQKCKTNEAHSFHIRHYLASHGYLDKYLDYMTKFQALFFYRNIAYIERNGGKIGIFNWLMQNVLTHRNVPLSSFTMKHSDALMPETIRPEITFERKPLNYPLNPDQDFSYSLDTVLSKEYQLEVGNPDYIDDNREKMRQQFEYSLSSVVQTKVLESSLLDKTDAVVHTLEETLMNHWIYLADKGIFTSYIPVKNPRTGEVYTLDAKDSFIFAMYCFAKALGTDLVSVPEFYVLRVQRIPAPTVDDIYKVAGKEYVDISTAQEIKDSQPDSPQPLISVAEFNAFCQKIFNANEQQLKIIGRQENFYARAMVKNMTEQLYCDKIINLDSKGQSFTTWLAARNIPETVFSTTEYLNMHSQLVTGATGYNQEAFSYLKNMQKAMINIMKQLSSYSIQFISKINDYKIKIIQWGVVRVSNIGLKNQGQAYLPIGNIDVISAKGYSRQKVDFLVNYPTFNLHIPIKQTGKHFLQIKVKPKLNPIALVMKNVKLIVPYDLKGKIAGEDPSNYEKSAFIGYSNYLALTDQQKNSIKDIYNSTPQY